MGPHDVQGDALSESHSQMLCSETVVQGDEIGDGVGRSCAECSDPGCRILDLSSSCPETLNQLLYRWRDPQRGAARASLVCVSQIPFLPEAERIEAGCAVDGQDPIQVVDLVL